MGGEFLIRRIPRRAFFCRRRHPKKRIPNKNIGEHIQDLPFYRPLPSLPNHLLQMLFTWYSSISSPDRSQGAFIQRCCVSRGALYSVPWPCSAGNLPPTFSIAWPFPSGEHGRILIIFKTSQIEMMNSLWSCLYLSCFGTLQGGDCNALVKETLENRWFRWPNSFLAPKIEVGFQKEVSE